MTSKNKRNVCTLISGATFVKSKHIKRFCQGFHTFCPDFKGFFPAFHQFKSFRVRLHHMQPRLVHHWP